jgi:hypothetical protein
MRRQSDFFPLRVKYLFNINKLGMMKVTETYSLKTIIILDLCQGTPSTLKL